MKMRRDLAAGEWAIRSLTDVSDYRKLMIDLGERYQPEYAFARMGWTGKETRQRSLLRRVLQGDARGRGPDRERSSTC